MTRPYDRNVLASLPAAASRRPLLDACDERGCLVMHHPADGVLVTRAAGHMSMEMATRWIASTEVLWRQPSPVRVFNDWEKLDTYDSAARRALTEWVLSHRAQMSGAWFLTGSKLVAMGVAAAGAATALAGVTMHASLDRGRWSELLLAALARTPR